MFIINEDKSIYITRGDVAFFSIKTKTDTGETYMFQAGDVVRFKVFGKKDCENVVLSKDFGIEAETDEVGIYLEEKDTKIGDVISKPTDYWYEVELNPYTDPQTIIGYDEDGAKVFKLFPEGNEKEDEEPITPEDIPVVDEELDLTSTRPVQNQAISRAILKINEDVEAKVNTLEETVYDGLSDARGRRLINVGEPEEDTDAVNKKYANENFLPAQNPVVSDITIDRSNGIHGSSKIYKSNAEGEATLRIQDASSDGKQITLQLSAKDSAAFFSMKSEDGTTKYIGILPEEISSDFIASKGSDVDSVVKTVYKQGGVISGYAIASITNKTIGSDGLELFTIASKYRPKTMVISSALALVDTGVKNLPVQINPLYGKVDIFAEENITGISSITFSFTYIIAE